MSTSKLLDCPNKTRDMGTATHIHTQSVPHRRDKQKNHARTSIQPPIHPPTQIDPTGELGFIYGAYKEGMLYSEGVDDEFIAQSCPLAAEAFKVRTMGDC